MKQQLNNFIALFAIIIFSLSSCSEQNDLSTYAQKYAENMLSSQTQGYFKLSNFNKNDGISKSNNGVESKEILFSAVAECIKDGGFINVMRNGEVNWSQIFNQPGEFMQPVKIGDKYNITGN